MKKNVNPAVSLGVIAVVLVLILVLMYRHSFRPTEGSMQSLPPDERARILSHYGVPPRPPLGAAKAQAPGGH